MDPFQFQKAEHDLAELVQDHRLLGEVTGAMEPAAVINLSDRKYIRFSFRKEERMYACKILITDPKIAQEQTLELEISQFLSDRFCVTGKAPSICPVYHLDEGDCLDQIIAVKNCPSLEDQYLGNHTLCPTHLDQCHLLGHPTNVIKSKLGWVPEQLDGSYRLMIMGYGNPFGRFIHTILVALRQNSGPPESDAILLAFDRILFQLIFTLAVVQEEYPGFVHDDLHVHNLRVKLIEGDDPTLYSIYHFGEQRWQLPIRGDYAMIADQESAIIHEAEDQITQKDNVWKMLFGMYTYYHQRFREMKTPRKIGALVLGRLERLLEMELVQELEQAGVTWMQCSLRYLPRIAKSAKTPAQYLLEGYFDQFLANDQTKMVVLNHYHQPE